MMQRHDHLCALADSLPGAIRWRYRDYEQLLRKQLEILLAPPVRLVRLAHRTESPSSFE